MQRRHLLTLTGAALALTALPAAAQGLRYSPPEVAEAAIDAGRVVVVHFATDWCSDCRRQARVLDALRAADPRIDRELVLVTVNYDQHADSFLAAMLHVQRRSTLTVVQGDTILASLVATGREADLRALLDTALAAAGQS